MQRRRQGRCDMRQQYAVRRLEWRLGRKLWVAEAGAPSSPRATVTARRPVARLVGGAIGRRASDLSPLFRRAGVAVQRGDLGANEVASGRGNDEGDSGPRRLRGDAQPVETRAHPRRTGELPLDRRARDLRPPRVLGCRMVQLLLL